MHPPVMLVADRKSCCLLLRNLKIFGFSKEVKQSLPWFECDDQGGSVCRIAPALSSDHIPWISKDRTGLLPVIVELIVRGTATVRHEPGARRLKADQPMAQLMGDVARW
jgi:hypothetical protein